MTKTTAAMGHRGLPGVGSVPGCAMLRGGDVIPNWGSGKKRRGEGGAHGIVPTGLEHFYV